MRAAPRIAIVGAGIVGSAIAYFLAARGASVTLIDAAGPGAGVTDRAFGWINVALADPDGPGANFKHRVIDDYRKLDDRLHGRLNIAWQGALSWSDDPGRTEARFADLKRADHRVTLLDTAQVARLEPTLKSPPALAIFAPEDGMMRPGVSARVLAAAAMEAGAALRVGQAVDNIEPLPTGGVRLWLGNDRAEFDRVVLAAGAAVADLCRPLGLILPLEASPSILTRFRSPVPILNRIVESPEFEARMETPNYLVTAESYQGDRSDCGPEVVATGLRKALATGLTGGEALTLDSVQVGMRPVQVGCGPIVGRVPGSPCLYIAAFHPGVILAATIGGLVAQDMLDETVPTELEGLAPR
ncbi:FAD-binding oxidoreductase [Rhodospirillaceae bacterium KN72]|uniref:FAD-binding oxidoreductase n=1 Tax=Pacificispira spongiicola TaxID=2729598 RepID=A0A7Y0DZB2_9PROT|nr:FAD-binding oxidoreductase [Pacificispira spongiicola]NMM44368.1 FAD-binding oxidoreductase [Pacificispira spongiicola]